MESTMDILIGVCREFLENAMEEGKTLTKGMRNHLKRLFDDMPEPSTFNEKQQGDLHNAIRLNERLQRWVRQITKGPEADLNIGFPPLPDPTAVDTTWESLAYKLRCVVSLQDEEPERLPTAESVGYLTYTMEDIMTARLANDELEAIVDRVRGHVKSPYAVQALMGAILSWDLFRSPEPMCGEAAPALLEAYDVQRANNNIAAVQYLDMILSKALFDKPERQIEDRKRAVQILNTLGVMLQDVCPDLEAFGDLKKFEDWALDAVQLKKDLMISPHDYRIHISKAGDAFDPVWMTGVAKYGRPVDGRNIGSRKVALCLFPAILKRATVPLNDDASITDALLSRRKFLPTPRERHSFDLSSCVAKATVLVM